MSRQASEIVEALACEHRVIVLGGLAVIAHGMSRTTHDSDVWLEPQESLAKWCDILRRQIDACAGASYFNVSRRESIPSAELEETVDEIGMVRIGGLDRYLDVFWQPHLLDPEDFDRAWETSSFSLGNARVMDEAFLIATKIDTGRVTDQDDISFLEKKIRAEYRAILLKCDTDQARKLFARYLDHVTALAALENPDPAVQALALDLLRELAAANNPFAIEALQKRGLL